MAMTTITISIDDNNVNINAPENASTDTKKKTAQLIAAIDELKEHVNRPLPEIVYNEIFDNVRDEICNIMRG